MGEKAFKLRTKRFALDVLALVEAMPKSVAGRVMGRQPIRCATSVGANRQAACRAESTTDMLSKLATVEEEADGSACWLEVMVEGSLIAPEPVANTLHEANELTAMIVASRKTLQTRNA